MEIIFDEEDLEPMFCRLPNDQPEFERAEKSNESQEAQATENAEAALPSPDALGQPPEVFDPNWFRSRTGGAADISVPNIELEPEPTLFDDLLDEPVAALAPVGTNAAKLTRIKTSKRKTARARELDELYERVRDDGLIVEVDPDNDDEKRRRIESAKRSLKAGMAGVAEEKPKERQTLMQRAVAMLSRREYSRLELKRKLLRKLEDGEMPDDVPAVIERLESLGYLSDDRYAGIKARSVASRMGDAKIRYELKIRGVDDATAREAVAQLKEPEEVRAYKVWLRRYDELPANWKEREKQTRYLAYRGFSMSSIQKVLCGEVELSDEDDVPLCFS